MAVSSMLPPECSLHPESDDEESFVVLGHSLPPECNEDQNDVHDLIDSTAVQQSISLTVSALELTTLPKLDDNLSLSRQNVSVINTTPNMSVDLSPDEIQQKVDLLIEENLKLKETLHQNNLAMKKQYGILLTWQGEVSQVHASHKQKFDDIKKYVEKLKLENAKLSTIIITKTNENEELQNEIKQLQAEQEIASAKDKVDINVLKSSFENLTEFELLSAKKKIKELEQQLLAEKANVKELLKSTTEQHNLKDELEKCKLSNEKVVSDLRRQLKESEALQKILLDEVKSLKAQLATSHVEENKGNFEEQLMAAQMHITNLELLRNEDRETINSNEEKIARLENQVKEMSIESDTLSALHTQVELCKADFEAEHQSKVALGLEKEQIAEDLRNLQRRNQQLLEQIERCKSNDYVYVAKEEQASIPSEHTDFRCPKCNRKFVTLHALEEHVLPCINIDGLF